MVAKEYRMPAGVYKVQTFGTTHICLRFEKSKLVIYKYRSNPMSIWILGSLDVCHKDILLTRRRGVL
jgi:hypothetical protein